MARPRKTSIEPVVKQPAVEEVVVDSTTEDSSVVAEVVEVAEAVVTEESSVTEEVVHVINGVALTAEPLQHPVDWFKITLQDWYCLIITKPNEFLRVNVYLEHDGDRIWLGDSDVTPHTTEAIALVIAKRVAMESLVSLQKMVNRANNIQQL